MTAPPGIARTQTPGGSTTGRTALTGSQIASAIGAAQVALATANVEVGASKVARLIRGYSVQASKRGVTFHEWLSDQCNLTDSQRRVLERDPWLSRALSYADPTGELATHRAMKCRARR